MQLHEFRSKVPPPFAQACASDELASHAQLDPFQTVPDGQTQVPFATAYCPPGQVQEQLAASNTPLLAVQADAAGPFVSHTQLPPLKICPAGQVQEPLTMVCPPTQMQLQEASICPPPLTQVVEAALAGSQMQLEPSGERLWVGEQHVPLLVSAPPFMQTQLDPENISPELHKQPHPLKVLFAGQLQEQVPKSRVPFPYPHAVYALAHQ